MNDFVVWYFVHLNFRDILVFYVRNNNIKKILALASRKSLFEDVHAVKKRRIDEFLHTVGPEIIVDKKSVLCCWSEPVEYSDNIVGTSFG